MTTSLKLQRHMTEPFHLQAINFENSPLEMNQSKDFSEYRFTIDDLNIYAFFQFIDGKISGRAIGDNEYFGFIDAIIYLYNLNSKTENYHLSMRELDFYLRNSSTIPFFQGENTFFVHFFDDFVNWIDKHIHSSTKIFADFSIVEKIDIVTKIVDEQYNLKFNREGKLVNIVDVEGFDIVVELKGIEVCSQVKELELLQKILQDKLNCIDINVIPEF